MENYPSPLFFKQLLCFRSKTCAFSTSNRMDDGLLRAKSRASAGACQLPPSGGERGSSEHRGQGSLLGRGPCWAGVLVGRGSLLGGGPCWSTALQQAHLRSALLLQPRPGAAVHVHSAPPLSPGEGPTGGDRPA